MSKPKVVYVRMYSPSSAGVFTYAAVRAAELSRLLAEQDGDMTVEPCQLTLPIRVKNQIVALMASPLQRQVKIIGTVAGGTWVSGPLEGQSMSEWPGESGPVSGQMKG